VKHERVYRVGVPVHVAKTAGVGKLWSEKGKAGIDLEMSMLISVAQALLLIF
jgi:hypothetical protein